MAAGEGGYKARMSGKTVEELQLIDFEESAELVRRRVRCTMRTTCGLTVHVASCRLEGASATLLDWCPSSPCASGSVRLLTALRSLHAPAPTHTGTLPPRREYAAALERSRTSVGASCKAPSRT